MEKKDYTGMSNAQIKQDMMRLENEFETIKLRMKEMGAQLVELHDEYKKAEAELNRRKTIY
jgi:predicted  nucleic acid-binding Zn-ribbon protein